MFNIYGKKLKEITRLTVYKVCVDFYVTWWAAGWTQLKVVL